MLYPIVASDMDGTLLAPNHALSLYTKETLSLLTEKGICFIFATGRHHLDIEQIRDNLGINAFMLTSNGARIHDPDGNLMASTDVAPDIAESLYSLVFHEPKIQTHIYTDETWYTNDPHHEKLHILFKESRFYSERFELERITTRNVSKVFFTSNNPDILLPLEQKIKEIWKERVNVCFSSPDCLEVMDGTVSKGSALSLVAKHLNHSLKECISFGDGMNDVEMLKDSGKGCIMENASRRLKELLPKIEIIGTNADDAVAHYLRKLYNIPN